MKHIIHISPNTYPLKFIVALGYGDKDKPEIIAQLKGVSSYVRRHIAKEINDTHLNAGHGWCITCSTLAVIVLPVWKNAPEYYGLLHHELLHAVMHGGTKCNFKLSEDSEEFYTYMVQFLTTAIYKRLWA